MPDWDEGSISYDLPMFYSWNTGPVHFISLNTEFYYYLNFGATQLLRQYKWLINDLEVRNYQLQLTLDLRANLVLYFLKRFPLEFFPPLNTFPLFIHRLESTTISRKIRKCLRKCGMQFDD